MLTIGSGSAISTGRMGGDGSKGMRDTLRDEGTGMMLLGLVVAFVVVAALLGAGGFIASTAPRRLPRVAWRR
jgi:hypothetical protein